MKTTQAHQLLSLLFCCILVFFLTSCAKPDRQTPPLELPTPEVLQVEKSSPPTLEKLPAQPSLPAKPITTTAKGLIIIGEIEPVTIVAAQTTFPARIDTGATTSSIDAQQIVRFERDGKSWVRFNVKDRQTGKLKKLESKITRIVEIKRHGTDPQNRIVVKLKSKIGSKTLNVEFSLADRSSFEYPVLVGRNILEGRFLVDVSKKNTTSLMKENESHEN